MKKALLMIAVLLSLTACEKAILNDVDAEDGQTASLMTWMPRMDRQK